VQPQHADQAADAPVDSPSPPSPPGFGARGRVRRRARFLRKARELAYRDLGGLVYNLHRFGQRNDSLVLAKLATLSRIDAELRALEDSLGERQPVTVLREAGITACPRCAAIHSGEDRFCPNCGLPMSRSVDLPIAGAPAGAAAPAPAPTSAPAAAPQADPSSAATASFPSVAPAPPAPAPVPPAGPQPGGPAQPASPSTTPAAPATQKHAVTPPPGGRSPVPPVPAKEPAPTQGDDDQPTEIIRPPATGS
jgi:hypothetical protein